MSLTTKTTNETIEALGSVITDQWWRLNNLYKITDENATVLTFKPNWAQQALYNNMWYRSLILKARQLGMTTFIQIFMLDRALFSSNIRCGVVAHKKEDAEEFFENKIKFAYDNLPEDLRTIIPAERDTTRSLAFNNGSRIRVDTSMRSGTYQYIHISEFGKMCAKYADKAREVITGTLNAVHAGQIAFIESTAEGPFGEFYEMSKQAEELTKLVEQGKTEFTTMDWKFFFFPWYKHPSYVLDTPVEISDKLNKYFTELKKHEDITLTDQQKYWYAKKSKEQGDMMHQEFPSTSAEAFERSTDVQIYGKQLRKARQDKRITVLPIARAEPVNTFWDLGRNDFTAIWFHQHVEARHHFVYYYEERLEDLTYYVRLLRELKEQFGWFYGTHYMPHDVETTDISSIGNRSRRQIMEDDGLRPIRVVPKIRHLNDGIELTRRKFDECWFDEEACETGLKALAGYEWSWDEKQKTTRNNPSSNWAKNGADAFRQWAQGYKPKNATWSDQMKTAKASNRRASRNQKIRQAMLNPSYEHVL